MVTDCVGREVCVGDRIGVAFSYSRASVGYIRIGRVESLDPYKMRWERSDGTLEDKPSPEMTWRDSRIVLLDNFHRV